jgi:rubrerythrin
MKKPIDIGRNRTGVASAGTRARELVEGAAQGVPDAAITSSPLALVRLEISREAEPLGTVPPPVTLKGMAKTAMTALKGERATVLLDSLAERLAYERTGVRLYEALLIKLAAADPRPGGPTREQLQRIAEQELAHFQLLGQVMTDLGGDPTAVTPCANLMAVASSGMMQALTDPRVTLNEGLKVILSVELTDNDSWQTLVDLSARMDQEDLSAQLQRCLDDEEEHLALVRAWVMNGVEGEAGLEPARAEERPSP